MKSTILNTSKELTGFSDFPPPKSASLFMRNVEVLEYLESYARHFDLNKHIRFRTEICDVRRTDDYQTTGNWIVVSKELATVSLLPQWITLSEKFMHRQCISQHFLSYLIERC